MKKIFLLISLLNLINLYSQNPIYNIEEKHYEKEENAYYKDIDNFYNQFEGTWAYADATKTIRFKFKKKMIYRQSITNYYEDNLVGEIQYIENGIEKINSLNDVDLILPSVFDYSIYSIGKTTRIFNANTCIGCPTVYGMHMHYEEPQNDDICLSANLFMNRFVENGVEKIKIKYYLAELACGVQDDWETPSTTENFIIPYGEYILVKEN